jgi:competence protein ComFC
MLTQGLTRLGEAALDLLYPPHCGLCHKDGAFLCDACRDGLPRADGRRCTVCWLPQPGSTCHACAEHPTALSRLRSVYRYESDVRRLVHAFKFGGQSSLAKALGDAMAERQAASGGDYDLVVPVPLAPSRARQRGYNQAELLARRVATRLNVPLAAALRRTQDGKPQALSATAEERRRNVVGAFEVVRADAVAGRRILVVDDVATTGASLDACARTLLDAGAEDVGGLTLARED